MLRSYATVTPYRTKDGSEIRELMHPEVHGNHNQSLAQALIPSGTKTLLHKHLITGELYHVTQGVGRMSLGDAIFEVTAGDTVCINPGVAHCLENTGPDPLIILCCCSPPYSHEDTVLITT